MHSYTNRLIHETSPYLLQHAHNPVDWYPWGKEAFDRAKEEDKPVLVSIGYSACHWCHVMERESFENVEVADYMNQYFVNIKVDREERPDVDHLYMDAVQAMTGSGGWPLNVFITPEGKPFYGGTYFPPKRAFNRASWIEVLSAIAHAYYEKKEDIEKQADNLTQHLQTSNAIGKPSGGTAVFDKKKLELAYQNIMQIADQEWGGFGRAPKFPQTFSISFLLRYFHFTGVEVALDQALRSLDKMVQGGIYDHIGGGFARYSTDTEWLVPHFEKMLYDNALIVTALAEAYQLTRKDHYREVIAETLAFVERELMHDQGGFFSALDADSEGEEGKFYVWDYDEITNLLGEQAPLLVRYYHVEQKGNWEGKNILHTTMSLEEFARQENISADAFQRDVGEAKRILLEERNKRIRPSLDDKLLLSWNALMNSAFSKAYAATGNERYKEIAIANMNFLLKAFAAEGNNFFHSWKNGRGKHIAFLEDFSFLIAALLDLSHITADTQWLEKAKSIADYVIDNFADDETPLFFYTQVSQTDILMRKKEVYDSAIPSGNSVMVLNLYRLGILLDKAEWKTRAVQMVESFAEMAVKYPTSFGVWLCGLFEMVFGTIEVAITGREFESYLKQVLSIYMPHTVIMASASENSFPLLQGKTANGNTFIYLCKDYACEKPMASVEEFENRISTNFFTKHTIFK